MLLTGERRPKNDWTAELCSVVGVVYAQLIQEQQEHHPLQQQHQCQRQRQESQSAAPPTLQSQGEVLPQPTSDDNKDDDDDNDTIGTPSVSCQQLEESLLDVMSRLMDIGSHMAKPRRRPATRPRFLACLFVQNNDEGMAACQYLVPGSNNQTEWEYKDALSPTPTTYGTRDNNTRTDRTTAPTPSTIRKTRTEASPPPPA
jgi:hypothetical protein